MSRTYKTLMRRAQELQEVVADLKAKAGTDTHKRLVLEECYSALGTVIKKLALMGVIFDDETE